MAVSRQTVDIPSLKELKIMLDVALSNINQWKVSLSMSGRLEGDDISDPCPCKASYVSVAFFMYENKNKDTMGSPNNFQVQLF